MEPRPQILPKNIFIIGGRKFAFPKNPIKWPENTPEEPQQDEDEALAEEIKQLRIMSGYNDSCCPKPILSLFSCFKSLFCCCTKRQRDDNFSFIDAQDTQYYEGFE